MSISTVKNNMYQSYASCGLLENDLNQLIDILNSVEDSDANIVSEHISTVDYTMDTVKTDFETMLQVNKDELHILFSEFNSKTGDMISELDVLSSELNSLSSMADELYTQYTLNELDGGMKFLEDVPLWMSMVLSNQNGKQDDFLSADNLREFIPNIVRVKNELQVFKMMIDANNKKLMVGVRK